MRRDQERQTRLGETRVRTTGDLRCGWPTEAKGEVLGLGRGGHFISRVAGTWCPKVHAGAKQKGEGGGSLESTLICGGPIVMIITEL